MSRTNSHMRRLLRVLGASAIALAAATFSAGQALARPPVVVELYQSQGCSSCPPANANVMALADRPDVLALSFQVTYWDQLGWKDTFASAENTQRQWDYAHGFHHTSVGTPEVVINGRSDVVGVNRGELNRSIRDAGPPTGGPDLALSGGTLSVGAGEAPRGGADIWLVRYDPRVVQVAIKRGENGGRTLPHRNVVHELKRIGSWSGAAQTIQLSAPSEPGWRTAILVQGAHGGPILSALKP
ncbi:MAG: DUF1223 domain-containing protein [Alphaproteobacteria bacterium]|nr:DUF1223 domain-containing protein [Alphaproteobacteria bacterium]